MNDVETSPAAPAAGSWKELASVAVPLVISNGTLSLMYVVDRVFLTWYSPDALAASLPAMLLHWMIMSFVLGTAGYTGTFVAQYDGAGRPERVSAAVWQGVWFTLIAGGTLWCFAPLAAPILA